MTPGLRNDGIPLDGRDQVALLLTRAGDGDDIVITATTFNYFRTIRTSAP